MAVLGHEIVELAEKAAGTAAEGLTFAETLGAALEAISPSDHMAQPRVKKLYDDAVQYYDELTRITIDPMYGPVTKPPQQQGFPLKRR